LWIVSEEQGLVKAKPEFWTVDAITLLDAKTWKERAVQMRSTDILSPSFKYEWIGSMVTRWERKILIS
jgi:hypothetical protein